MSFLTISIHDNLSLTRSRPHPFRGLPHEVFPSLKFRGLPHEVLPSPIPRLASQGLALTLSSLIIMIITIAVVNVSLQARWLVQECRNPPPRTRFCILHWGHSFYFRAICLKALKAVQARHRPYCQCPPIPFLVHRQQQTTQVLAILMYHC